MGHVSQGAARVRLGPHLVSLARDPVAEPLVKAKAVGIRLLDLQSRLPESPAPSRTPAIHSALRPRGRNLDTRVQLPRMVIEMRQLRPAIRVLDLGCGTRSQALVIKRRCPSANVVGIDIDPDVLAIARRKAAAADPGGRVHSEEAPAHPRRAGRPRPIAGRRHRPDQRSGRLTPSCMKTTAQRLCPRTHLPGGCRD